MPASILGLAFSVFLGGVGGGVAFPILPLLGTQLGLSAGFLGLILSANRITRLLFNQSVGSLANRWSPRTPVVLGLLIESAATYTYVLALQLNLPGPLFLLGRALWGIGSAFLIVGAMTAALNMSERDNRGSVSAWVRTALNLGFPAGLTMGGLVAGSWGDGAAFWTATISSLFGAVIIWFVIPAARPAQKPKSNAAQAWWPQIRRGLLMAMRDPYQRLIGLMNMLFFFSLQGVLFATLVLLIDERNLNLFGWASQSSSGMLMAFMSMSSALVTILVGKQLDRSKLRLPIVIPTLYITSAGFLILAFSHVTSLFVLALILLGVGMGGISIPLLALLGDITPVGERGNAVGLYQVFGDVGGALGPIVGLYTITQFGSFVTYISMTVIVLMTVPPMLWLHRHEAEQVQSLAIKKEG